MGSRKDRETSCSTGERVVAGQIARAATATARAAAEELRAGGVRIEALVDQYEAATGAQRAGRVAEEWHATTLNEDAIRKGLGVRAYTTAGAGQPHAKADIVSTGSGARAQVKYYASPEANATGLSRPEYSGMQKVVPAGEASDVAAHARRRGTALRGSRPERSAAMRDTAENVAEVFSADGAQSKPLSRADAIELAKNPKKLSRMAMGTEFASAARAGALSGAVVGSAVGIVTGVKDVVAGDASAADAAARAAVTTCAGAAMGAGTAVLATAAARVMTSAGLKALANGSAPVAAASTVLEIAGGAVDLARGRTSGGEFAANSAKAAGRGIGMWAGAEVGAALGTLICPGLGTVVGGIAGSLAAGFGLSKLF